MNHADCWCWVLDNISMLLHLHPAKTPIIIIILGLPICHGTAACGRSGESLNYSLGISQQVALASTHSRPVELTAALCAVG